MQQAAGSATGSHPIEAWQRGPNLGVPDLCVHQLFDLQVRRDPHAIAVVFGDRPLTYGELDARANRLAHRLIEFGVGRDVLVGVCLDRSFELVIALLAILKAGGSYLPIDPEWPTARKLLVMAEIGPRPVVVVDPRFAESFGAVASLLDPEDPQLYGYSSASPDSATHTTGQLAYVNFTSGSTGRPKGVMIEHRGILRLIDPSVPWKIGPGDRVLHLAPAAFDAATLEIWAPLLSGAAVVVAPPGLLALDQIAGLLRKQGISLLFLTSGLFHAMASLELDALAGVRKLLAGGEVLDRKAVQAVLDAMPPNHFLANVYGPTESTTFTTYYVMDSGTFLPRGQSIPIGRPLAGTTVKVLDSSAAPCPIGKPGELYIGGEGLARGYLNDAAMTASKFVSDSQQPGDRLYQSGDLVSWNPDGTLAFHGRVDSQVKVSGIRIEPAEIESVLREHPTVARVRVVFRMDNPDRPLLVAYWVADTRGQGVSAVQLREFLSDRLPSTMIPAALVLMEDFPLTASGKVDLAALPAPNFGSPEFAPPQTSLERQLSEIWSEVLGHGEFGTVDNFFMVGGGSIAAVRLKAMFKERFDRVLPLSLLFTLPTIRQQGAWLDKLAVDPSNLVSLRSGGDRSPLICVHGLDGGLFYAASLARVLAPNRPVLGLQWLGKGNAPLTDNEIREMSSRYADRILERLGPGPLHLHGFSIGGWYAYALAAALLERGAEIGLVTVADSHAEDVCIPWYLKISLSPARLMSKLSTFTRPLDGQSRWNLLVSKIFSSRSRPESDYVSSLQPTDADALMARPEPLPVSRAVRKLLRTQGLRPDRLPLSVQTFGTRYANGLLEQTWSYFALNGARSDCLFETHYDFIRPENVPVLAAALDRALEDFEKPTAFP